MPDQTGALAPADVNTCPAVPAAVNANAVPVPYAEPPAVAVAVLLVPPFAIGSVPVTPVVRGKPVALVKVPELGVPSAPLKATKAPAEPTLTAKAVATPVPKPVIEPTAGVTVVLPAKVNWP